MNYPEGANGFWDAHNRTPFNGNETKLYFGLLHLCNRLGWKNPFNQSNGYLSRTLSMSINTIKHARKKLITTGLISITIPDKISKNINGQTTYQLLTVSKSDTVNTPTVSKSDTLTISKSDTNIIHTKKHKSKGCVQNWESDFSIYLNDCKTAFRKYYEDKEFIKSQEFYNPGVNVRKTLMKAYENFWGTEAGWEFKKKKRTKEINWKQTITNAIGLNKVYYTKEEKAQ